MARGPFIQKIQSLVLILVQGLLVFITQYIASDYITILSTCR